jgi:5'(3')-deoxyribonucleotidase
MSEKKILFLDMDDVMSDTGQAIVDLYNQHFKTEYTKENLAKTNLWEEEIAIKYLTNCIIPAFLQI